MTISEQIREYLAKGPTFAVLPEHTAQLTLHVAADGTVRVVDIAGDTFALPIGYLDEQHLANLSYADGLITIELDTGTRHYRPVGIDPYNPSLLFTRTIPLGDEAPC